MNGQTSPTFKKLASVLLNEALRLYVNLEIIQRRKSCRTKGGTGWFN